MSFLLRRVLAIFLIVGLGVSPIYASAMKGMEQSAQASSMAGMADDGMADDGMADDMPCHPAKSSPDKTCPFITACLSLCFQGMPPAVDAVVAPTTVKLRAAIQTVYRLASLAPSPPARPPRT